MNNIDNHSKEESFVENNISKLFLRMLSFYFPFLPVAPPTYHSTKVVKTKPQENP
jgi:hypothetical protein